MITCALDSAVATALAHQVLGMHWAKPVEDSPEWEPCPESRGVELRPLMVGPRCRCAETPDEPDELYEQMYGFTQFNGHSPFCVTVAPRYSTDPVAMMLVLDWLRHEWGNVELKAIPGQWRCRGMNTELGIIDATADKLETAVALAAVKWAGRGSK